MYGYATVLGLQSDPTKIQEVEIDNFKQFFSDLWSKITTSITSLVNFFIGDPENVEVDVEGEDTIDFS
jgi:hypothetical protein